MNYKNGKAANFNDVVVGTLTRNGKTQPVAGTVTFLDEKDGKTTMKIHAGLCQSPVVKNNTGAFHFDQVEVNPADFVLASDALAAVTAVSITAAAPAGQ